MKAYSKTIHFKNDKWLTFEFNPKFWAIGLNFATGQITAYFLCFELDFIYYLPF